MAKGKFGGADFMPHHLGAEPAAPVSQEPEPAAVGAGPLHLTRVPATAEAAVAVSKARRVSFSSRVSPEALQQIQDYAHNKKVSQADILAEALNLFFRAKNLEEVA